MRARLVVAYVAWVLAAPAAAAEVRGTVRHAGRPAPAPGLPVTKDAGACGASVPDESLVARGGGLAHVVVTVQGLPAPAPLRASLDQRGCRYVPHVLALPVGSTLQILNGDPILHSVHGWAGRRTRFEIATPDRSARGEVKLDRPGLIELRCDVHAWMKAYVHVVASPAAVSGEDGSFALQDVPAGTYTVTAWHERLGERSARVEVPAVGAARLDLTYD